MPDAERCIGFAPIVNADTRLLILGSMPGVASLTAAQYYAHPRNGFWPIAAEYLTAEHGLVTLPDDFDERYALLLRANCGLWDVLATAERKGSLDASIRNDNLEINDFSGLFDEFSRISHIALNGQAASKWFHRLVWPTLSVTQQQRLHCHTLPSTSPAHATMSLPQKSLQWQAVFHLALQQA